ncbi:MAG TPA: acyloxyacyl hydrolase [Xanthomonadales bacterium]|nr:acyloxyacyl hydrolase [Xanthomonadales bacterium]
MRRIAWGRGWVGLCALLLSSLASARTEAGLARFDEVEGEHSWGGVLSFLTDEPHPWEVAVGYIADRSDFATAEDVFWVAGSRRAVFRRWFASAGIAATTASEDNEILSGTFQFYTGFGWQGERWTFSLRHLSNAGLQGRNRGETFLVAAYAF